MSGRYQESGGGGQDPWTKTGKHRVENGDKMPSLDNAYGGF